MKSHLMSGLFGGMMVSLASTGAMAQIASPPPPAPTAPTVVSEAPPESAFLLQARMQTQQGLLSVAGIAPGFLVGYQLKGVAIGVGLGYSRLGLSLDSGESANATIFRSDAHADFRCVAIAGSADTR